MSGNAYVSHKHKLVVFWSPKCACSAVVDWFFNVLLQDINVNRKRVWLAKNGYLCNYKQSQYLTEGLGYSSIQFTRDPASRAVSAYLNKFYIYRGEPIREFAQLESFAKEFIARLNQKNGSLLEAYAGISFVEYLEHVAYLMSKSKVINSHWDTQIPRNVDSRIKPDHIVKQETFDEDLRVVNNKLGLRSYIPDRKNITSFPDDFRFSDGNKAGENSLNLLLEKQILTKDNLLSEEVVLLIKDIYREDYECFGY